MKAIAKVLEKGGIEADDQNEVSKKQKSNEKIKERVENSLRANDEAVQTQGKYQKK